MKKQLSGVNEMVQITKSNEGSSDKNNRLGKPRLGTYILGFLDNYDAGMFLYSSINFIS